MPDYRETTINIVYDDGVAYVWTSNRRLCNKLRKMGAKETSKAIGGYWYQTPADWWSPRKRASRRGISGKVGRPFTRRQA